MKPNARPQKRTELFLPDFCGIQMLFDTLVVGELLALILTLDPAARNHNGWQDLALISLFIQWVALCSLAGLCLLRRVLERIGDIPAAIVSFGVISLITLGISEIAYQYFLPDVQLGPNQFNWLFDSNADVLGTPHAVNAALPYHSEFLLRNTAIGSIVGALTLRYFYVRHQWRQRMEMESKARIQALQSRIRPHFLFNSMNTIASLTRSAPELAEQVTEDLADLFRVSLADASVSTRLDQELELCRRYLRIEGHRFGPRLRTVIAVDDLPANARLPGLTLQPLLENAIYHGIEPAAQGGEVRLEGRFDAGRIQLCVINSLPGNQGAKTARDGNQMAIDNVSMRLDAFFSGQAKLSIDEQPQSYQVTLEFPYVTEIGPHQ